MNNPWELTNLEFCIIGTFIRITKAEYEITCESKFIWKLSEQWICIVVTKKGIKFPIVPAQQRHICDFFRFLWKAMIPFFSLFLLPFFKGITL